MCDTKSQIKLVLRDHCPEALERIVKSGNAAIGQHVPVPAQAENTIWDGLTTLVQDVALDFNGYSDRTSFRDVSVGRQSKSRGSDLVDMLLKTTKQFFMHESSHTVALVADMDIFGTPAKKPVQDLRMSEAETAALKHGITKLVWNRFEPTPIVQYDLALPSMESIRATPGAIRHVIYETMRIALATYTPPAKKRVIFHYVDYDVIIPHQACDWLPENSDTNAFTIGDDFVEYVRTLRTTLCELSISAPPAVWRKECFELAKGLAECGALSYNPICLETGASGVTFEPFRLTKYKIAAAEADLSMLRHVNYLYTGEIQHRLVGPRMPKTMSRNLQPSQNDRAEMVANMARLANSGATVGSEFYIGPAGVETTQRCVVVSCDTDLITLLLSFFAIMVANYDWSARNVENAESAVSILAPHAPILVLGEVYTRPDPTLPPNKPPVYGTKNEPGLSRWFEILNVAKLYALITRRGNRSAYQPPLGAAIERSKLRAEKAAAKGQITRANNKRKAAEMAAGKYVDKADPEPDDDDNVEFPVIRLPPLSSTASIEEVYARVMNFNLFVWIQGNDYLAGLPGVNRGLAYIGFCEFLHHERHLELFRTSTEIAPPEPDRCKIFPLSERPPTLRLMGVDPAAYMTLLRYMYYCNLQLQLGKTNKTSASVQSLSYEAMAALTAKKWSDTRKHMPSPARLDLMKKRLEFVLYMAVRGPTSISAMIDPVEHGWDGDNSILIV